MGIEQSIYGPLRPQGGYGGANNWQPISQSWAMSDSHSDVSFLKYPLGAALLLAGGGAAPAAIRVTLVARKVATPVGTVLRWAKMPIHSAMLRWPARNMITGMEAPLLGHRLMSLRQKYNLAMLGIASINPLENATYILKKDWTRLFINFHVPFVGVPIYNQYLDHSKGSGSPPSASPTEPKRSKGDFSKYHQHKRQERPT
jgi:uncharacterized short protein YbdD (DUF466 family)